MIYAMLDADYLRRQAEQCFLLSRATFDLGLARRLRTLADELNDKATELDQYGRTHQDIGNQCR